MIYVSSALPFCKLGTGCLELRHVSWSLTFTPLWVLQVLLGSMDLWKKKPTTCRWFGDFSPFGFTIGFQKARVLDFFSLSRLLRRKTWRLKTLELCGHIVPVVSCSEPRLAPLWRFLVYVTTPPNNPEQGGVGVDTANSFFSPWKQKKKTNHSDVLVFWLFLSLLLVSLYFFPLACFFS